MAKSPNRIKSRRQFKYLQGHRVEHFGWLKTDFGDMYIFPTEMFSFNGEPGVPTDVKLVYRDFRFR